MKRRLGLCLGVLVSLAVLIALCVGSSWGQAATELSGTVSDPSGAAIPGASVTLTQTTTNTVRKTTTGPDGSYAFHEIQPGNYQLEIEVAGFKKYVRTGVVLYVNQPATVSARLQVGEITQTVEVAGQAPLLNTTDASLGEAMGKNEILSLPLEEGNVVQLLSLEPGVVYTTNRTDNDVMTDTRSGAVNGERSDQSNVTLDGVDVNDQGNGFAFTSVLPVTIDSVEEFRVTTSNYNADEGRSAGAEVALVTRAGTNQLHGDAYELNRTAFGEANDFFIKSAEATDDEANKPLGLVHNVFGGSLGGPIKKDRLFFFFSYEGHRFAQQASEVRTVPTASLRAGVIKYHCADESECPGGTVDGFSVPAGYYALDPAQLAKMDPLHHGPSPVALAFMNTYPIPNDTTVGDGYNFSGFRWAAPQGTSTDWYITRIDYKLNSSGTQTLFFRGSARNDRTDLQPPLLPGDPPDNTERDMSKGFVAGYTAVLRSNLVNNLRYGLTRQSYSDSGDSLLPQIIIRNMSPWVDNQVIRPDSINFPVHNIVDDLSWTKGKHSFGFGANIRLIYNGSNSLANSFSDGVMNASWFGPSSGIANTGAPLDPAANNYPAVNTDFSNSYDFPLIGIMGIVTEVDATTNFHVYRNGSETALAQGAPVPRHFELHENELYAQDSWKLKPNLTLTYGLRWEYMAAPWETDGQEVAPTEDLGTWFQQRGIDGRNGIPSSKDPPVTFALAGKTNNARPLWGSQTKNFAPRVGIAYSPRTDWGLLRPLIGTGDKTVIRAGFGMFYDHFGEALLSTYDTGGAFGLASTLSNPAGIETEATAPRVTNMHVIPQTDNTGAQIFIQAPATGFPQTFPNSLSTGGFCICWGLDSSLKTPYSYALDLNVQRQLPHNMSLEVGYVGHLGHRLLAQDDLAMPLDLVDTKTGIDYFSAVDALAHVYRTGVLTQNVTPAMIGKTAPYWPDMLQSLGSYPIGSCVGPNGPTSTASPLQAAYDLFCSGSTNETTPLFVLDYGFDGFTTKFGPNAFFNPQYSSLYAWRSIGFAGYNALQVTLHKRMSDGLRFDFNYTYSRSIDLASDAERVGEWGGLGANIINAWQPYQLKGVSDFDLTHQINANWTWELPVGNGRQFGSSMGKGLDALVGGWALSGVTRWSTGFPVNVAHGFEWPTNWQLSGEAITLGQPPLGRTVIDGNYNLFTNQTAALAAFGYPFPGQAGARNVIRGDGFMNTDMTLMKTWKMPYNEQHTLQFRWDVFNVFNMNRFDVQTASLELDESSTFGDYTHLLTNPRQMEFGLRYQF